MSLFSCYSSILKFYPYFFLLSIVLNINCNSEPEKLKYTILNKYAHPVDNFTQGLTWEKDTLYEGTGLEGKSRLIKSHLKTGTIYDSVHLDSILFGEGICKFKNLIYQLTWKNHLVLVYDAHSLEKIKTFPLSTEGWGICTDGTHLIVSNGSNSLYYYSPEDFKLIKTVFVKNKNVKVSDINELEYVNGSIYANQWNRNTIYKINSKTAQVEGILNLQEIFEKSRKENPNCDVLNGIAYNNSSETFYVTGKFWPSIFEITIE